MAKANAKAAERNKKIWLLRVIVAAVLIAALAVSLIWTDAINRKLGLVTVKESAYGGNSLETALAGGDATADEVGKDLNVHFVDVGQGDACIIELPDERTMLIDAAKAKDCDKLLTYIEDNIKDASGQTITYFDYAILTHPDEDHCGGMGEVLSTYPAKVFYRPNVAATYAKNAFEDPLADEIIAATGGNKNNQKDTKSYDAAIEAGYNLDRKNGIETTVYISDATNEEISVITPALPENDPDYYTFTFYAPVKASYKDWNDYSPVMILDYHGKRFMLSGDAEKEAEADFVAKATEGQGKYAIFNETYQVDVIKLGHHGSRTSSSQAFLDVLTVAGNCQNTIAIVSCGLDNDYGHPHKETIDRLKAMGFSSENIVGTYQNGTIAMQVRGKLEGNLVQYDIYMGAEMVRRVAPAVGNDTIALTWKEIAFSAMLLVVLVLLVLPLIAQFKKSASKETKKAAAEVYAAFGGDTSKTKSSKSSSSKSSSGSSNRKR